MAKIKKASAFLPRIFSFHPSQEEYISFSNRNLVNVYFGYKRNLGEKNLTGTNTRVYLSGDEEKKSLIALSLGTNATLFCRCNSEEEKKVLKQ
jgi:hypothetical protein